MKPFRLCLIAAVFVTAAALSSAADQRLHYAGEEWDYEILFDDARIPAAQMQQIAALSPWVDFSPRFSIGMDVRKVDGKELVRKSLMAPELELCVEKPGDRCVRNPDIPDEAFLENGARNLQAGDKQVDELRHEKLPRELEPVRQYLLKDLTRSLEMEKARYEYLQSGNLAPMRRILCDVCPCASETGLLGELSAEKDARRKLAISRLKWHNEVLRCSRQRGWATYPVEAWDRFIRDYGITEKRRPGQVE